MLASRTLTPAEKRYSQIAKEALAIVFAIRRSHKMVYGQRFAMLTDHKPLLAVFGSKSGLPAHSANRLQRQTLILLEYDFDIHYKNSENFCQEDDLSQLISTYPMSSKKSVVTTIDTIDCAKGKFH